MDEIRPSEHLIWEGGIWIETKCTCCDDDVKRNLAHVEKWKDGTGRWTLLETRHGRDTKGR